MVAFPNYLLFIHYLLATFNKFRGFRFFSPPFKQRQVFKERWIVYRKKIYRFRKALISFYLEAEAKYSKTGELLWGLVLPHPERLSAFLSHCLCQITYCLKPLEPYLRRQEKITGSGKPPCSVFLSPWMFLSFLAWYPLTSVILGSKGKAWREAQNRLTKALLTEPPLE